ncbi:MAG: preprotein translocase subunit SecE [Bacilli bacterium]|jgi:preprotein translocase SecE subunit
MGKIVRYFKGVGKEMHRIRWVKKVEFWPAVTTILIITIFAAAFLAIEDAASATIINQLRNAFESIRG